MKVKNIYKLSFLVALPVGVIACNNGYSSSADSIADNHAKVQNGKISTNKYLNSVVPLLFSISPDGGTGICSGTLLDANTVLTAAHCVLDMKNKLSGKAYKAKNIIDKDSSFIFLSKDSSKAVSIGENYKDLSKTADGYLIDKIYVHKYAYRGVKVLKNGNLNIVDANDINDLAIIKLSRPASNSVLFPILATNNPKPNTKAVIAGYGVNVGDGVKVKDPLDGDSGTLRVADSYFTYSEPSGKLIAVGGMVKKGKKSYYTKICQGDSGGPDFMKKKNVYVLTGVHSFGFGDECGIADREAVSMSIAAYYSWITSDYIQQSI